MSFASDLGGSLVGGLSQTANDFYAGAQAKFLRRIGRKKRGGVRGKAEGNIAADFGRTQSGLQLEVDETQRVAKSFFARTEVMIGLAVVGIALLFFIKK